MRSCGYKRFDLGAVIRKLLIETNFYIINLDKIGYASDLTSINKTISTLGIDIEERYKLLKVDLTNCSETYSNSLGGTLHYCIWNI